MNKIRCDKCGEEFLLKKKYLIFEFLQIDSSTFMTECPKCKNIVLAKIHYHQE